MDTIKVTLMEVRDLFLTRMATFEGDLEKAGAATQTTTSLVADFASFKSFMLTALRSLQDQVDMLAQETDQLDMRGRRKILLVHGVAETQKEDTAAVVTGVMLNSLGVTGFSASDISRCHRMGRPSSKAARPIVVKFKDMGTRNKAWFSKKKLKGTGVTLSEFLTKRRHEVFVAARLRFGVKKCWTRDGFVYLTAPDGSEHRITTQAELRRISDAAAPLSLPEALDESPAADVSADKPADVPATKATTQKKLANDRPQRSTRK